MNASLVNTLDEELLASKKPRKDEAPVPVDEQPKWKSRLKNFVVVNLYVALAIFSFLFFLIPKLPYENLSQSALAYLSQLTPFTWQAESVSSTFLLGPAFNFKKLSLTSKPVGFGSGSATQKFDFDTLTVSPYVFSAIPIPMLHPSTPGVGFSLSAYKGQASGDISFVLETTKTKTSASTESKLASFNLKGEKFDLEKLAVAAQMHDYDLKGLLQEILVEIIPQQGKLSRGSGKLKAKLKSLQFDPAGLNLGMALPILSLGDANIEGSIRSGRLVFERTQIGNASADAEVMIDGSISLREPLEFSDLDLRVKLKFAPKILTAVPLIDGFLKPNKRPDGYYGLKINGSLANPGMPTPYLN